MNSPSRSIGSGAGVPVSEASRGLFDVCSGVGASSRGRFLAESLGVVLTEERRTKRMRAEGNSKENRCELTRVPCGGAEKTTVRRARTVPRWRWRRSPPSDLVEVALQLLLATHRLQVVPSLLKKRRRPPGQEEPWEWAPVCYRGPAAV